MNPDDLYHNIRRPLPHQLQEGVVFTQRSRQRCLCCNIDDIVRTRHLWLQGASSVCTYKGEPNDLKKKVEYEETRAL